MTYTTFFSGPSLQQSSEPVTIVDVMEIDTWPVDDRSESGAKDQLAPGLHPVVAIGDRSDARRPLQCTGVVVSVNLSVLGTDTDRVEVDIADGKIIRQYVSNITAYSATSASAVETTPYVGQPVFVDDSSQLGAGTTLSMSPLNQDQDENPLAGHLWYCQDEIADGQVGGPRESSTFDVSLPAFPTLTEQVYCVKLTAAKREMA